MVGRRLRTRDIGDGLVSQRIGQFERSRQSQRKGYSFTSPIHNSNLRSSSKDNDDNDDGVPFLQSSQDSDSPHGSRSSHSETASWRQFQDDGERNSTFNGPLHWDGSSSSVATESSKATETRIDNFMEHLERLEKQEKEFHGGSSHTEGTPIKSRSRIRSASKQRQRSDKKSKEEEELDKLVLETSSSGSNGASEWFKGLLEEAISKEDKGKGTKNKRNVRRVRWNDVNQEHHFTLHPEEKAKQSLRDKRRPSPKKSQSWMQASAEFRGLFHDNDPDSILQSPPRQPSRVPSDMRSSTASPKQKPGDWDFDQQIFPSSSSSSEEAPEGQSPLNSPSILVATRNHSSPRPTSTMNKRSSPELLHSQIARRVGEIPTAQRTNHDPPATIPSFQDNIRNSSIGPNTRSSGLDPDGVLFDTNIQKDSIDEIALQNNLLRKKQIRNNPSAPWVGGEAANWEQSPRSTWIPVAAPDITGRQDVSEGKTPSPEDVKMMRLRSLKESLQEKSRASVLDARDDDDDSSLFSDLVSLSDQHSPVSRSPKKVAVRRKRKGLPHSRQNRDDIEKPSSLITPSAGSHSSTGSRSRRNHKVTFAEDSDISLFDPTSSSSESDDAGATLRKYHQEEEVPDKFAVQEPSVQVRNTPVPISTNSYLQTSEEQTFTPVADNRSRESTPSRSHLPGHVMPIDEYSFEGGRVPVGLAQCSSDPTPATAMATRIPAPLSMDGDIPVFSSADVDPSGNDQALNPLNDGDSATMTSESINPETISNHPPFTSVRDTVASPHSTSAQEDFRGSTSIEVGIERDGHRPFTSVRETVASRIQPFQETASQLLSPPSSIVGRSNRQGDTMSGSSAKPFDSQRSTMGTGTGDGAPNNKGNGHTRDYWKSIRALKTLGSFDSLSAINDPQRKSRKSQEFVDRDDSLRGPSVRPVTDPLSQWNQERGGSMQQHSRTTPTITNTSFAELPFRQSQSAEKGNPWRSESSRQHQTSGGTIHSAPRLHNSRIPDLLPRSRSGGTQHEAETTPVRRSQTAIDHHDHPPHYSEPHRYINNHDNNNNVRTPVRRSRTLSPPRDFENEQAYRERLINRVRSANSFASPTLFSRDSEDSASTTDDQTMSILDGGTTVGPTAACCTFTIGDLSWGLEWLRFGNNNNSSKN